MPGLPTGAQGWLAKQQNAATSGYSLALINNSLSTGTRDVSPLPWHTHCQQPRRTTCSCQPHEWADLYGTPGGPYRGTWGTQDSSL